jgi:hypothetical protein
MQTEISLLSANSPCDRHSLLKITYLTKVFPDSFAGDVDRKIAVFMADSQVPWGVDALGGAITEPAWKSKPSWYLQVRDDKMIPYPAQQFMAKRAAPPLLRCLAATLSMSPIPRPSPT